MTLTPGYGYYFGVNTNLVLRFFWLWIIIIFNLISIDKSDI